MARTIKDIVGSIKEAFVKNTTLQGLYGLDVGKTYDEQFSDASLETVLIYIVATAHASLENIFDYFRRDITRKIENERYGQKGWYENLAKEYEHGVNKTKVVSNAFAGDGERGIVELKVAKKNGDDFEKLTEDEKNGLSYYVSRQKPAGIFVKIISEDADNLGFTIDVYYNPTIIDSQGNSIDGSGKPVEDAINSYLQGLEFNGEFVTMKFVDAIQEVEGVEIVEVKKVEHQYLGYSWAVIDARQIPYSGFYKIDDTHKVINYYPV